MYFFFSTKQIIFRVGGQNIKIILEFFFSSTFRKITVGEFVNQLIQKNLALVTNSLIYLPSLLISSRLGAIYQLSDQMDL